MSSGPRVCQVVPALFGFDGIYGGAERYVLELSRVMAERTPTTLVAFGSRETEMHEGKLRIRVLRNWANFRRFVFDPVNPALLSELRRADIIHYHQPHTMMASLALAWARAARRPIFATHLGGGGLSLHALVNVDDWYTGHLHISEFSRRTFGHERRAGARVILGGVDTEKFSPPPVRERTDEVLFVGRLLPHKGINYLIEAVGPETQLTVMGRPWSHAQEYHELLHRLAVGKRVRFVEDGDDASVVRAYQRSLCVVLPSVTESVDGGRHPVAELLGQTLLEGMACGTPAICTDVCSLPEVVEDGVTGFVVPPNDPAALREKIRWLRANPDAAGRMGEAARRRVLDLFTWDHVVSRCFQAYGI